MKAIQVIVRCVMILTASLYAFGGRFDAAAYFMLFAIYIQGDEE